MSLHKTTSEETKALASKHGIQLGYDALSPCPKPENLAALIDEVRGVDAAPVGTLTVINGGVLYAVNEQARKLPDGDYLLYTHPAPSQPAVPMTDQQIIEICNSAGVMWVAPDEDPDGYPGGFDMSDMKAMRALLSMPNPAAPVELPRSVRLGDAPESLNINDKAFWVIGYNKAIDDAQAAVEAAGRKAS